MAVRTTGSGGDRGDALISARSPDEVLDAVAGILARELRIPRDTLSRDTHLIEDLRVESMDVFLVICDVEKEFSVRYGADEVRSLRTVGELADSVVAKTGTVA